MEIIKFLVERCSVNITHEHEELLLVLEDKSIITYMEEKLQEIGINTKKIKIDQENSLNKNRPPRQENPEMERRLANLGKD